jgi:hypothetical protein
MFGGFVVGSANAEMVREGSEAFQALVDAIVWLQKEGLMRPDDTVLLARSIWALVHGVAMLIIDGLLGPKADWEAFARFAIASVRTGTEG